MVISQGVAIASSVSDSPVCAPEGTPVGEIESRNARLIGADRGLVAKINAVA
jgi:hypothetical protein